MVAVASQASLFSICTEQDPRFHCTNCGNFSAFNFVESVEQDVSNHMHQDSPDIDQVHNKYITQPQSPFWSLYPASKFLAFRSLPVLETFLWHSTKVAIACSLMIADGGFDKSMYGNIAQSTLPCHDVKRQLCVQEDGKK